MKILLLNYEFPPLGGGAGNATKNIAREMTALGHSVTIITTWFKGFPEIETVDGYTVHRVHSRRQRKDRSNVFEMFHYVWCAIQKSNKIVPDFKPEITISFFAIPTGIVALYLKRKFKIPYILSLRGGDVPGFLPMNLKYYHIFSAPLTNMIWKNAVSIVANGKGLQELAEKTATKINQEVLHIPNGVNTKEFYPDVSKQILDILNIIFVGRLTEQKGVTFLIDAIQQIKDTKINCGIIGDGPLRESLEKETRESGLEGIIKFHGWVSREELRSYYQKADLFILPSYEEGMPNVVLEALASGLAIIATDIGGNDELVATGINGFLYKNHSELPALITKFISNPGLKAEFGKASCAKAQELSWKNVAEKYITICQNKK